MAMLHRRRVRRSYRDTLVPEAELVVAFRAALRALEERVGEEAIGDYLEFGVCHGTAMICMHGVLDDLELDGVRLFGFDSFEGLPEEAAEDDDGMWKPGQFDSDVELTRRQMTQAGVDWERTALIEGWFRDTLNDETRREHGIEKAGVVMVDCDMYLSAKEALDFVAPLVRDCAVIIFDDWGAFGGHLADNDLGEKRAFDEFLSEHPIEVVDELEAYCDRARVFVVERTGVS